MLQRGTLFVLAFWLAVVSFSAGVVAGVSGSLLFSRDKAEGSSADPSSETQSQHPTTDSKQARRGGEASVARLDANRLREGLVGLPCDNGQPAKVTVTEIRLDGHLIVDFHGQQWILENIDSRDIVDGQDFRLSRLGRKWRVIGTHFYGGIKSWRLKKVDE